jgi:cell division protein FtsB
MRKLGHWIHLHLHHPGKVFIACLSFAGLSLLFNGGLLKLYSLHRDHQRLTDQIQSVRMQISELDQQLKRAKDPAFIERQALDRYDLVEEHDLLFVFADE